MAACEKGNLEVVKLLVTYGAHIDAQDSLEETALYKACESDEDDTTKIVEFLLKTGKANPNIADDERNTALMNASQEGNLKNVQLLVHYKATIDVQDEDGFTALLFACTSNKDNVSKCVEFLLKTGKANPNIADEDGQTPLMAACEEGNLEIVKLLVTYGAHVDAQDKDDNTALANTCYSEPDNATAILTFLLQKKANPNTYNKEEESPFMICCKKGNLETAKLLFNPRINLIKCNTAGHTALTLAIFSKNPLMIKWLLQKGAILTPDTINAAWKIQDLGILKMLLEEGVKRKQNVVEAIKSRRYYKVEKNDLVTKETSSTEDLDLVMQLLGEDEQECPICLEKYKSPVTIHTSPEGIIHSTCSGCAEQLLASQGEELTCPLCRYDFTDEKGQEQRLNLLTATEENYSDHRPPVLPKSLL